ncbi:hypothetical protein DSD19_04560 [Rhodovulum sp. BSW8]|uniref:phage adaptor protein n=1 Tax=Rhodovulum sp. BSW8 TaxID=2259645 RepID=UPI000DE41F3A|nr:DUF6682 family protein [Rhodovulum sp. BSW8]RBO54653.1 hypothetical protein DSD19_04560 [Rhodovulum sp. BSW8]
MATAKDVLSRAQTILQDAGATRWPLPELLDWLNDATLNICTVKPTACAAFVSLDLTPGTEQALTEEQTQMLKPVRNIAASGGPGRSVTIVDAAMLDAHFPAWTDPAVMPATDEVRHVIVDVVNPTRFRVFPPNTGAGKIEAHVALRPAPIPLPANSGKLDSYGAEIGISPVYLDAIVDYVVSKAFSKDAATAGAATRSVAHFQRYQSALGIRQQVENTATANNG